jgi:hypothetical protein
LCVQVTPPPPSDTTPPVIVPQVVGTLGNNSWYISNVTVTWSVTDDESAISSQSGCGPASVTSDTGASGTTFTCTATSASSTRSQSVTIKRDATAPTIAGARTPAANLNGWNNTDVTVSFTCADGLSGLSSSGCPANATVSSEGANQSRSGTVTDKAGNSATATVSGINIDKKAPVVTAPSNGVSGTAGLNGWYKSVVTQTFNASDALSGLVGSATFDQSSGTNEEGDSVSIPSGPVSDKAGNTVSTNAGPFKIDLTNPTIQASLSPANPAPSGWYNAATGAPTVSFNCSDAVSGLDANACPGNHTFQNGVNQSHEGTVTDRAGHSASTTNVNGINVDLDPPNAPTATTDPLNPVANSEGFFKDQVKVSYGGNTDVGPSGVKGYSDAQTFNATGTHNYSGTATDNAGNESAATTGQVKVDAGVPSVAISGSPTNPVVLNSTQSINVTASDEANGSGLVSDPSGSVSLDTGSVGSKSKTITVEDKVGHTKSATCSYSVKYGFSGFLRRSTTPRIRPARTSAPSSWAARSP